MRFPAGRRPTICTHRDGLVLLRVLIRVCPRNAVHNGIEILGTAVSQTDTGISAEPPTAAQKYGMEYLSGVIPSGSVSPGGARTRCIVLRSVSLDPEMHI